LLTFTGANGYTIKLQDGNDFSFNDLQTDVTLVGSGVCVDGTISPTGICSSGTFDAAVFGTGSQNVDGLGTFNYQIKSIGGSGSTGTSANSISFIISSATSDPTADLTTNLQGNKFAVHICSPISGTTASETCPDPTFFAGSQGGSVVPEPSSLLLFGSGLFGIVGLVRLKLTL
jgi:hypothetical protein